MVRISLLVRIIKCYQLIHESPHQHEVTTFSYFSKFYVGLWRGFRDLVVVNKRLFDLLANF